MLVTVLLEKKWTTVLLCAPTLADCSPFLQAPSPSARRRRRRERADAARNRRRLLDAAAGCSPSAGWAPCRWTKRVAAAAGVGKGTVFRRFGDKSRSPWPSSTISSATSSSACSRARHRSGPARHPSSGWRPSSAPTSTTARRTWSWSDCRRRRAPAPATASAPTASGTAMWRCCSTRQAWRRQEPARSGARPAGSAGRGPAAGPGPAGLAGPPAGGAAACCRGRRRAFPRSGPREHSWVGPQRARELHDDGRTGPLDAARRRARRTASGGAGRR